LLNFLLFPFSVLKKKAEILKDVDVVDVEQGTEGQPTQTDTPGFPLQTELGNDDLRGFDRLVTLRRTYQSSTLSLFKAGGKL
jgi:hypothetical protein